jgi:fumarylacetoacetate (FAA) hydrolase
MLVSQHGTRAVAAGARVPSLIYAMQRWDAVAPLLQTRSDALNTGTTANTFAFDPTDCAAQWLDASAFLNHGRLMARAFNTLPIPDFETIPLPDEVDGIDFEGEFGVVCGPVHMAARTRKLTAGCIVGGGTVSNVSRAAGFACIT